MRSTQLIINLLLDINLFFVLSVDVSGCSDTLRKHQIIVISDEIYGRLRFDQNHISLAKVLFSENKQF